jgi:hypothetical protein
MSDEHPAGESPAPDEAPAPGETPAQDEGFAPETEAFAAGAPAGERPSEQPARGVPSPARQGVMAALILFGIAVGVELFTLLMVRLSGDPNGNVGGAFLIVGLLIFFVGLFAALTITTKLPPGARVPFWAMGVICICLTMLLWGVTCGLAGTPRFT